MIRSRQLSPSILLLLLSLVFAVAARAEHGVSVINPTLSLPVGYILMDDDPTLQIAVHSTLARNDPGGANAEVRLRYRVDFTEIIPPPDRPGVIFGGTHLVEHPNVPPVSNTPITDTIFSFPAELLDDSIEYELSVTVAHQEGTAWVNDATATLTARIGHFSPRLDFGGGVLADIDAFSSPPQFLTRPNRWRISITGGELLLTGPDVPVAPLPAAPNLEIQRDEFGQMVVLTGELLVLADSDFDMAGFPAQRGGTRLGTTGIITDQICFHLPAGIGWRNGSLGLLGQALCSPGPVRLRPADLQPAGSFGANFPGADPRLVADILPLAFDAASWEFQDGTLTIPQPTDIRFLPSLHFVIYASRHGGDVPDSNAGLWRAINPDADGDLTITGGLRGGLSVELSLLASDFFTHFPRGAVTHAGGPVHVVNSRVDSASSQLHGVTATVLYSRECPPCPGEDFPEPDDLNLVSVTAGTMPLTPTAGLHGSGLPNPATLRIARTGDGQPVHSLSGFSTATYHLPGAIVPPADGFDSPFDDNEEVDEPGEPPLAFNPLRHLLSPVDPVSHGPLHPGLAPYLAGLGHLPGINFQHFAGLESTSRIGGGPAVNYEVATWWRGYVRMSGFTGVHQSDPAAIPPALTVHGYPLDLENLGWSYLSNLAVDSITDGTVEIPFPSSFSVHVLGLDINCCGEPTGFDLDSGDLDKQLAYWNNSQFHIQSGRFNRGVDCPNECATDPVLLELGVRAPIGGAPGTYGGFLYPLPDGQLTNATEPLGRASTLLVGPTKLRDYSFLPVREAYFNDHAGPNPTPAVGFQVLAGALDVAYFEDIAGVAHTHGGPAEPHLTFRRAWENAAGETFFTNPDFDTSHRGFPAATALVAEYQDAAEFDPIAQKDWFGGHFHFPVVFHDLGEQSYFRSDDPEAVPLVVGTYDGQVQALTRDGAHVTFGEEFEFLPKLTLSNGAGLAIDGLTESISDLLVNQFGSIQALLDTQIAIQSTNAQIAVGANLGPLVDTAILDPMLALLRATNCANLSGTVNTFLDPFGVITDALDDFSATVDNYDTVASWIEAKRLQLQTLRDQLWLIRHGSAPGVEPQDLGLLTDAGLQHLLEIVVGAVPTGALDPDLVQELWIEMIGTGPFDSAVALLRELADESIVVLDDLIEAFGDFGEFTAEVQTALSTLSSELANALGHLNDPGEADSGLKLQIFNYLSATLCDDPSAYDDPELRTAMRAMIVDRILGLDSIATLESILRTFVYHAGESLKEVVASTFDLVNTAARTIAGTVLFLPDAPLRAVQGYGSHFLTGSMTGYAVAEGDDMRQLRLDGRIGLHLPSQIEFQGFLEYNHLTSTGPHFCNGEVSARDHELIIGASATYSKFLSKARKMSVTGKWGFTDERELVGFAGSLELLDGGFSWASLDAAKMSAHLAMGREEHYLACGISAEMNSVGFALAGGFFVGKTCTAAPLSFLPGSEDDQFDGFLPFKPEFSGGIAYAEGAANLVGRTCLLRLRVGAGVGGYLLWDVGSQDEVVWGGRLKGFASGELLCIINGKGEVILDGRHTDGSFNMNGRATLSRKTIFGKNKTRQIDVNYRRGLGFRVIR